MSLNGRVAQLERDLRVVVHASAAGPTEAECTEETVDLATSRIFCREFVRESVRLGIAVRDEVQVVLADESPERAAADEAAFDAVYGASRLTFYRERARAFVPWARAVDTILENTLGHYAELICADLRANLELSPGPAESRFEHYITGWAYQMARAAADNNPHNRYEGQLGLPESVCLLLVNTPQQSAGPDGRDFPRDWSPGVYDCGVCGYHVPPTWPRVGSKFDPCPACGETAIGYHAWLGRKQREKGAHGDDR